MPCHMFAFIVIVFAFSSNCILADCISNGIFVVQFILVMWVIKIFNNVFTFRLLPQNVNGCHLRKSYHSIHMISRKNYYLKSRPNTDISDADGWVLRYPKTRVCCMFLRNNSNRLSEIRFVLFLFLIFFCKNRILKILSRISHAALIFFSILVPVA